MVMNMDEMHPKGRRIYQDLYLIASENHTQFINEGTH